MTTAATSTSKELSHPPQPPAEPWFWAFILADMSVFALFFGAYLWTFGNDSDNFRRDATSLLLPLGVTNTLVLLASSYLVVRAVRYHRAALHAKSRRYLNWALGGGAIFVIVKSSEYAIEVVHGHGLTSSPFFMYYFVLTGLHLMHVAIGAVLLGVWRRSLVDGRRSASRRWAESSAGYWHMVDLLWIVIFSFLYIGTHA